MLMNIIVSGKFSHDVFDIAHDIVIELVEQLDQIDFSDINTELDQLVCFPVIISDEFPITRKSMRSYSSKEKSEYVSVEIDYDDWVNANLTDRRGIMLSVIKTAIET